MKFILYVPQEVLNEVKEAADYYDIKQDHLGLKLYDNFEDTLLRIEENPLLFQKNRKNYRQALLSRFPYLIIFRVYGENILVNKFIHAKRNPVRRYRKK